MLRQIDAAALRRRAAEHQRGAGRRVDLLVVVHLENLDVEAVVERLCHPLGQRRDQIDAHAEVAGLHDHRALGRLRDQLLVLAAESPVVPTMCTPLPAVSSANAGGGRNGEIDEAVGVRSSGAGSVGDRDAVLPRPASSPESRPISGGARRLDRAREHEPLGLGDGLDQRAPHAPAGARHDQPHVGHGAPPAGCGRRAADDAMSAVECGVRTLMLAWYLRRR